MLYEALDTSAFQTKAPISGHHSTPPNNQLGQLRTRANHSASWDVENDDHSAKKKEWK
jgi:hypothetical protein